jgi:hypothetical protein
MMVQLKELRKVTVGTGIVTNGDTADRAEEAPVGWQSRRMDWQKEPLSETDLVRIMERSMERSESNRCRGGSKRWPHWGWQTEWVRMR